jgi:hypothetical protein
MRSRMSESVYRLQPSSWPYTERARASGGRRKLRTKTIRRKRR